MADVSVSGPGLSAEIEIGNESLFAKAGLATLVPKTRDFATEFAKPLVAGKLNSISFEPRYATPKIPLDDAKTLVIAAEVDTALKISRAADSPLFGRDDFSPVVEIAGAQCWVGFEIGGSVAVAAGGRAPNGLGVAVVSQTAATFAFWKLHDGSELLSDALGETLSGFTIACGADTVLRQPLGTVMVSDISGTVTVTGSWIVPASVNSLALADTPAPVKIEVAVGSEIRLAGSVAVTGELVFRSWRKSDRELVIGLYKKKGTTLAAKFLATGGLEADVGETDLIGKVFGLLRPEADVRELGDDPQGIRKALEDSVDRSLTMSVNAVCSAAFTDESALVYTVDPTSDVEATREALNHAIAGDWTKIAQLRNAHENRNTVAHAVKTGNKLVVNVLGVYSFASVAEFMRRCTVVHCPDDGSATITDVETAKRLTAGAAPFQAARDQLRKALSEAAVATAAYTFADGANKSTLTSSQTLVIYHNEAGPKELAKELAPAVVLGQTTRDRIAADIGSVPHKHALVQLEQRIGNDAAGLMFFDPATGQPWTEPALRAIGIAQLEAFLDPNEPDDKRRLDFLRHWPEDPPPPPYYVDWLDITWWAESVAGAARAYATAKAAFERIPPGADPSANPDFTRARGDLAKALLKMSRTEHSAFTPGWPLAVMNRIARGKGELSIRAMWDGRVQLELPAKTAIALTL